MSAAAVLDVPGARARACSICGELGHRADNARHRTDARAMTPAAATPAHPWRDPSPAASPPPAFRPAKRCTKCGSSEHRANNKVAHPSPTGAEDASPAPTERPRWTPADDGDDGGSVTLDRARAKAGTGADGRQHAATLAPKASWAERRSLSLAVLQDDKPDIPRPRTRGDCGQVLRPCPFVSCSQHLYLDVNEETGSLKLNFPHLEPWELRESCALDVAERSGITLEEVASLTNLTRERIRQIEFRSIRKLQLRAPELAEPDTRPAEPAAFNGVI